MFREIQPGTRADGLRVGVVVSRYHAEITEAMREAALKQFSDAGGAAEDLHVVACPGAYELVAISRALAARGDLDAVVALGCIIAGETNHDRHIASAVAHGLSQVTVATGVPVAFGVLTCQSIAQAQARAGGDRGNKGAEAMAAAIEAACAVKAVAAKNPHPGTSS
jgi:6,7-dimethyl-8-ribityllumazine synthase